MSIPFSNTHQRIPRGFANLLEGLTREVLRDQPKDIPRYAASYFGKLLKEREEAAFDAAEWGAKIEDRFYNDAAFLERSGSQESLKEKPSETLSGDSLEEVCSFDDLFDEESETIIQAQSKGRVSSKEVLEMGSSEVLERVSKESLKMGSSEVLEMVGKESLEMGSIEALAMGSEEELEMESKEVLEMESKEVLEMASKESLEMGREEVLKIRSKEGSKMGSKESLKMGSKEVLKMASKESLEMGRKKVLKMGSKEGLEMGSKEVLKMGSKEVLKMGSKESLKMGSKEVLKMGSKEGLEMESKEALEMGSKEALETRSKEALEIRSKEVLETASKESLKMGSKEVLEMESKEVLKMGSKEGLDMGSKETFEMRSKEALEMGSKEALEMGSKEALEMGSKEALVMGSKEGLVMGSKEGLEMGSKEGLEMGSKEVLKMGSKEGQEMGSKEVLEVEEKEEEEHVEQVPEKDILVDRIEETILKEEILPLYEEENTTARSNISGEGPTHSGLNPGDSYDNFVDEEEIGETKQDNPQEEIESTPEQAEHSENNPNTETKDVTELIKEEHNKADDEMINDLQEEHEIDEANHEQVHQETEMKGQDGGEQYPEPTTHEPLAEMSEQEASEVLSVPPEVATTDDELMEERHQELLIDGSEAKAVQEEDNLDEEVLGKNSNVYSKGEANITEADTMSKQEEEVLDIPLDDPDANAAAAKIQAGFRGHMTRKKMKGGEIDVKGKEREGSGSTSAGGKD